MPRYSQFRRRTASRSYAEYFQPVAKTLLEGASSETVEYYYTANAEGDGSWENPQSDTPVTPGNTIRRKLWYKNEGDADPDGAGWVEFSPQPADDTTYLDAKALIREGLKAAATGEVPLSLKMTYEEVSGASYLLDDVTGSVVALSLRKLSASYAGNCIRVRRASDNAEQDIGFSGDDLDTATLESFCAGTNGFIRTWYDQSGNSNHAQGDVANVQQPQIVSSGSAIVLNGQPAMQFNGSHYLRFLSTIKGTVSDYTVSAVHNRSDVTGYLFDTATGRLIFDDPGTGFWYDTAYRGAGFTHAGQTHICLCLLSAGGIARKDGANVATGLTYVQRAISGNTALGSNNTGGGSRINGTMQELVIWDSDKSADAGTIDTNVNDHYSIY